MISHNYFQEVVKQNHNYYLNTFRRRNFPPESEKWIFSYHRIYILFFLSCANDVVMEFKSTVTKTARIFKKVWREHFSSRWKIFHSRCSNVSLYAIPTPKNNDVRAVAIESLMRKYALIAIRKTALRHCAFSLILTVIGECTWIHYCVSHSVIRACISRLCIPACWVLTARYREHDKWKAKRLSFICQFPFLTVDGCERRRELLP